MKLNKATQDALRRHLPLAMGCDEMLNRIVVLAITAEYENGDVRTRALYRGDFTRTFAICREIFNAGGAINVDDLPWLDMNIWTFGWTPELVPLRNELRKLWRTRESEKQPEW